MPRLVQDIFFRVKSNIIVLVRGKMFGDVLASHFEIRAKDIWEIAQETR